MFSAHAGTVDISALDAQNGNDRFIVKFRGESAMSPISSASKQSLAVAAASMSLELESLRRTAGGADVVKSNRKLDRVEAESMLRQLAADPGIEYVAVDGRVEKDAYYDDTYWPDHWGLTGKYGIRADQAWSVSRGEGVVVAVLDTGLVPHHDLHYVHPGYDFVSALDGSRDGDGWDKDPSDPGDWTVDGQCSASSSAKDSSWHGTHVAGTIGAVTDNGKGVAGIVRRGYIIPVRVLGACGGYMSDVEAGIAWASGGAVAGVPLNPNPAEVINLSLSGASSSCPSWLQTAINDAVARGTTIVAAAGNNGYDARYRAPANCANVITVAATTSAGTRSYYSNYGDLVDIAAPGDNIVSTVNAGKTVPGPGRNDYAFMSGTSMATPHVSSVVALLQAAAETPKSPAEVLQILKSTASPFAAQQAVAIGAGIVNAKAAVDAVYPPSRIEGLRVDGLSTSGGQTLKYQMYVPPNASQLTFEMSSNWTSGRVQMYVRHGSEPTDTVFDCWKYEGQGANNFCAIDQPIAGTYYVNIKPLYGDEFKGVGVVGHYLPQPSTAVTLVNGKAVTGLSAAAGGELKFKLLVPEGAQRVDITLTPGTGNPDLYWRYAVEPTANIFNCAPRYQNGVETCEWPGPDRGAYYVTIRGHTAFSGATLIATYK